MIGGETYEIYRFRFITKEKTWKQYVLRLGQLAWINPAICV